MPPNPSTLAWEEEGVRLCAFDRLDEILFGPKPVETPAEKARFDALQAILDELYEDVICDLNFHLADVQDRLGTGPVSNQDRYALAGGLLAKLQAEMWHTYGDSFPGATNRVLLEECAKFLDDTYHYTLEPLSPADRLPSVSTGIFNTVAPPSGGYSSDYEF